MRVDDRDAGSFTVPAGPAAVGLRSVRTAAKFSAFALTNHVSLHGASMRYLPRLLRSGTRAALTDSGVAALTRRQVVLEGVTPEAGVATTFEFELTASWSSVDIVQVLIDDREARIRLQPDGYRVTVGEPGSESIVASGVTLRPQRLSIRTQRTANGLVMQIGEVCVPVAVDIGPAAIRRIELVGARLHSLDQTGLRNQFNAE
jgi:hypothetical protein